MSIEFSNILNLNIEEIRKEFNDDYNEYKKWLIEQGLDNKLLKQKKFETLHKKVKELLTDNNKIVENKNVNEINKVVKNKTISGKELWNLSENKEINENYQQNKSNFINIIKKCHDILYSRGGSIVGIKAQNDIMRILCLKILEHQFKDENSSLWEKCNIIKSEMNMSDNQFNRFKSYCVNLKEILKKDDIINEWKLFVLKFLSKIFPSIYYENDSKFNCDKSDCIKELISVIYKLEITEDFMDSFSTTCGDIHESFRSYSGSKPAKELGQYFTPRHLIHLIFYGIGLDNLLIGMDNITIYDPCMGTGGFLTRLFKLCNITSKNIHGCETEIDTIKFGNMSMVLTTGCIENNIVKCNSLSENPFIFNKKFSAIVTNPPFGTKMKYEEEKERFEKNFPGSVLKFEDVYPVKNNNGPSLFIQHCVYMLDENGVCAIVLPDGELFDGVSKWSKDFRKWWATNVNIQTILKVSGGTFEHTSIETCVVIFTKNGPTKNIQFIETTKKCNIVKDMFSISMDELQTMNYSLDVSDYLVEETDIYDVPMVQLGEVCQIINGTKINSKKGNDIGKYPLFYCSIKGNLWLDDYTYDREGIIINSTNGSGKCKIYYINGKYNVGNSTIHFASKSDQSINKYLYLYLFNNIDIIKKEFKGPDKKTITIERFNNIKIPLPSVEVQQQIVDELSLLETSLNTIQTRISQLKVEKEQYKKYGRKAEIQELLKNSEKIALGDVCDIINGTKINSKKGNDIGKYPLFYCSIKGNLWLDDYTYDREGIIINSTNGSGKCKIYYINGKYNVGNSTIHFASKSDQSINKYLYLYLFNNIDIIKKEFKGPDKKTITIERFNNIKIPLPSVEVQQQCIELFEHKVAHIQSIDDKITQEKIYIDELKELAKDIISSYC